MLLAQYFDKRPLAMLTIAPYARIYTEKAARAKKIVFPVGFVLLYNVQLLYVIKCNIKNKDVEIKKKRGKEQLN